jgi:hypothetical protein
MTTRNRSTLPAIAAALMLRQGDVLLVRVNAAPSGKMRPVARDRGRVVLAYGETTGHAHAIHEPDVALEELLSAAAMGDAARELLASVGLKTEIRDEEVVGFLTVGGSAAVLQHEEHGSIALDAGDRFVVLRQREYAPESLRTVAD